MTMQKCIGAINAQSVWISKNGCYESPWCVTGASQLTGPKRRPKDGYGKMGLQEQGKAMGSPDLKEGKPAKNNKRPHRC